MARLGVGTRRSRLSAEAVDDRLTPAVDLAFRHTFATRLVAKNADLVTIKELMGPAEIRTTMRYAHTSRQAKRRAVNLLSDKAVTGPSEAA